MTGVLLGIAAARATDFAVTVRRAYRYSERATRFERRLDSPRCRVLVVGDSTAVGLGCVSTEESVAGRIAREFPYASIENHAQCGARVANVLKQLESVSGPYDAVLIAVGGNDVIRGTRERALLRDLEAVLLRARELSRMHEHLQWSLAAWAGYEKRRATLALASLRALGIRASGAR